MALKRPLLPVAMSSAVLKAFQQTHALTTVDRCAACPHLLPKTSSRISRDLPKTEPLTTTLLEIS